jgi:hypothetical protein
MNTVAYYEHSKVTSTKCFITYGADQSKRKVEKGFEKL